MAEFNDVEAKAPTRRRRTPVVDTTGEVRGKSRIRNARQQKIARMVEGYESATTASHVLRNILLLWLAPAGAMVALGLVILMSTENISLENTLLRWVDSARIGGGALAVVTLFASGIWGTKAFLNVRRLGKKPDTDLQGLMVRHLPFIAVGGFLIWLGTQLEAVEYPLTVVGFGLLTWAASIFPMWLYNSMRMLWRTSALADAADDDLPADATVWFVGLVVFFGLAIILEFSVFDVSETLRQSGYVLQGLSAGASAFFGAQMAQSVAARQETRLIDIVSDIDREEDDRSGPVTSEQIGEAWDDSERMLSFDY